MHRPPRFTLFPYTTLFRSFGAKVANPDYGFLYNNYLTTCPRGDQDRKSTRLNSSHTVISYAVFCLKKKTFTHLLKHEKIESCLRCTRDHLEQEGRFVIDIF